LDQPSVFIIQYNGCSFFDYKENEPEIAYCTFVKYRLYC